MSNEHPLSKNPHWKFYQPSVGFRSHYVTVDKESGSIKARSLRTENTCRESVIENSRMIFRQYTTNHDEYCASKKSGWDSTSSQKVERVTLKVTQDVDLESELNQADPTELRIGWNSTSIKNSHWKDPHVSLENFFKVCDRVLGPVCVLLSPHRPEGEEWWRTKPDTSPNAGANSTYASWNGSDNWFLAHPALMSIATGLYRQCYFLVGAGLTEEILETLGEEEVTEVMSTNSQKLALQIIKRTRPYIEVPHASNAGGDS